MFTFSEYTNSTNDNKNKMKNVYLKTLHEHSSEYTNSNKRLTKREQMDKYQMYITYCQKAKKD